MISSSSTRGQVEKPEGIVCDLKNILIQHTGVTCEENVRACDLTSYCLGGQIRYLVTLNDPETVSKALKVISDQGFDIFPLGAGTNLLVSDEGFNGVFIRLGDAFKTVTRISEFIIRVGGALKLADLVSFLRKEKLGGISFLTGIPGTVGGMIAMNAGSFGYEIKDHVLNVRAVTLKGDELHLPSKDCKFDYRNSRFRKERSLVLEAEIEVEPGKDINAEVKEFLKRRKQKHITKGRYAGSVFKNPEGDYAGRLLDEAGMRGMRVGNVYVSHGHANFFFSEPEGTANEVLELMQVAALRVYEFYGIKLYPEIELIGFDFDWDDVFD